MGSKNTREVYDYLLSIDYGVCHGPVDSVNQIWIKDKPIFCGKCAERANVSINLEELFGGDEGEGGPVGVVEIFMGDDSQLASPDLAARTERTIATMPGYRGLCHMFFRGGTSQEIKGASEGSTFGGVIQFDRDAEETSGRPTGGIVGMSKVFVDEESILISTGDDVVVQAYSDSKVAMTDYGFRWTSNNPYLPAAKANLTRLPVGQTDQFKAIWPMGTDLDDLGVVEFQSEGGLAWFYVDNGETTNQPEVDIATNTTDLYASDLGISGEISDYVVTYAWEGSRTPYTPLNPDVKLTIAFYADGPAPGEAGDVFISEHTEERSGAFTFEMEGQVSVPANTRYVVIYGEVFGEDADIAATASIKIAGADEAKQGYDFIRYNSSPNDDAAYTVHRITNKESVDLGFSNVSFSWSMSARVGAGPENFFLGIYVIFCKGKWEEVTNEFGTSLEFVPDLDQQLNGIDVVGGGANITGAGTVGYSATVPPGADFILVKGHVAFFLPLFVDIEYSNGSSQRSERNLSEIHCNVDGTLGVLPDANPAHMLYELMTNTDWGMGEDPAFMGTSFTTVAETLYDEEFGLSMRWTSETEIQSFAQEIIDHISAVLFPDPETGLWELRLLRGDYETDGLPVLDESNCTLEDRKRRTWGETINYITASYTDPQTEKDATVNADDAGNIAMQGAVVRDTRNYYGIRNQNLAQTVANRDVRAAAYPLYSAVAKVDRTQWNVRPGDVRKLSWPEDGIEEMIVRVMSVDYGSPKDRYIKLSLAEDVFALDSTTYTQPQTGLWQPESAVAQNMQYQIAVPVPLPFLTRNGIELSDVDADFPLSYVGFLGFNPSPRVINFDAYERFVPIGGGIAYRELGQMPPSRANFLTVALPRASTSRIPASLFASISRGDEEAGDFFLIGADPATAEIVQLKQVIEGDWDVVRGAFDTVPREWPVGTIVWEFADTDSRVAALQYAPADDLDLDGYEFRLAPRMFGGRIAKEGATPLFSRVPPRPHLPFRPSGCQLEETGFGPWRVPIEADIPATVTASWKTRNRTVEDSVTLEWADDSVAPESGQTTVLRIVDPFGNLELEITGLTGETYEIPIANFGPLQNGFVQFYSENSNGDRSYMAAEIEFDIRQAGYGFNYGFDYGGPAEEPDPEEVAVGFGRNYGENYGG